MRNCGWYIGWEWCSTVSLYESRPPLLLSMPAFSRPLVGGGSASNQHGHIPNVTAAPFLLKLLMGESSLVVASHAAHK